MGPDRAGARRAIAAALTVGALGLGLTWVGGPLFGEPSPLDECPRLAERDSYEIDLVLLPPGARECVVTAPNGTRREELYVPWLEWLTVALVAAGAGLGMAALTVGRRPALLAFGSLALTIAGLAAWFIGPLTALALLGIGAVLAAAAAAVRPRPRPGSSGRLTGEP
jgi:hypothetical protein